MPNQYLLDVIEDQAQLSLRIKDPEFIDTAIMVAYYSAMWEAGIADPLSDVEEQTDLLDYFVGQRRKYLNRYMELTNSHL